MYCVKCTQGSSVLRVTWYSK